MDSLRTCHVCYKKEGDVAFPKRQAMNWCKECISGYSRARYRNDTRLMQAFLVKKGKLQPNELECRKCIEIKPFTKEFFKPRKNAKWGISTICRKCDNAFKGLPDGCLGGITKEEAGELRLHGNCQICGDKKPKMAIDHCHSSGMFRGLLCQQCNVGLGSFRDNQELLAKAIEYLKTK